MLRRNVANAILYSMSDLSEVLHSGSILVQSSVSEPASNLKQVLVSRLSQYYAYLGLEVWNAGKSARSLEEIEIRTAYEALNVVERLQGLLQRYNQFSNDEGAASHATDHLNVPEMLTMGARDLALVRTLISIVFKWGITPLLSRVSSAWQGRPPRTGPRIIDLTNTPEDYKSLSSSVARIISLLFPGSIQGDLSRNLISTILIEQHLVDILIPSLTLAWLPKSLSSESTPTLDDVRPPIMRLISLVSPSRSISALGSILSVKPAPPVHALKACRSLLSRQLLRPEGIRGLFMALFTDEEMSQDSAPIEKFDHVTRVIGAVPAHMQPEEYFGIITPQIIDLFMEDFDSVPPPYIRAAAFFLSRMLDAEETSQQSLVSDVLLRALHDPFLHITPPISGEPNSPVLHDNASLNARIVPTPRRALSALVKLTSNIDPSPVVLTKIFSSIVPPLYALSEYLMSKKTSDPQMKESIRGLLVTWGRVVSASEGVGLLWSVILGEGGSWEIDISGEIKRVERSEQTSSLSLLTPGDFPCAEDNSAFDMDANIFGLRPDPTYFVKFLESIDRSDISSEILIKLLDVYRDIKAEKDSDPMRALLYLQILTQMQSQVSSGASSRILSNPEHALLFVKHALQSSCSGQKKDHAPETKEPRSLRLEDLRIVSEDEDPALGDNVGELAGPSVDEMTPTAINLLVSILDENEELSARSAPVLNDIFLLLEPLTVSESSSMRQSANEARMIMTARLASNKGSRQARSHKERTRKDEAQDTYQKALKLLQDPLLPVRAHGLLLLRELVSPRAKNNHDVVNASLDRALVPAILDIFLQAIRDDDSYIFLNGVQGLSAMVDGFGKEVLKGLLNVYVQDSSGVASSNLTQLDVDIRTRVGEALGQVIQRCGGALPNYANLLVPPLFQIVRTSSLPTALRTSALSLLALCAQTSTLALMPYANDLCTAMIDLLQLESRPAVPTQSLSRDDLVQNNKAAESMDAQPTSRESKLPPFRRAALHFLSLLLRACVERVYDIGSTGNAFPPPLMARVRITLRYISSVDEDAIVRVMARETLEQLDSLTEALLVL